MIEYCDDCPTAHECRKTKTCEATIVDDCMCLIPGPDCPYEEIKRLKEQVKQTACDWDGLWKMKIDADESREFRLKMLKKYGLEDL